MNRLFKLGIVFLIINSIIYTNVFADQINALNIHDQIIQQELLNSMNNNFTDTMSVNGTMSPFSLHNQNDVLSMNSGMLNDMIMTDRSQEILSQADTNLNMQSQVDELNKLTDQLNQLTANNKVFLEGYIYKYDAEEKEDTSFLKEEESNDNSTTETEDADTTEESTETSANENIDENTTDEDTVVPEDTETQTQSEISEDNIDDNFNLGNKSNEIPVQKTEYFTIVKDNGEKIYIQLHAEKKEILFLFNLIAGEDILVEMSGELKSSNFYVDFVTVLDELPETTKAKLEEYLNDNTIIEKNGYFITIEQKVYFLETKTDKIFKISTGIPEIEDIIYKLSDKGISVSISVTEYADYLDITTISITDEEYEKLTDKEKLTIELTKLFDLSKVYNLKSKITEENDIYTVTVENKKFVLKTANKEIETAILDIANSGRIVYIEGNLARNENCINVTYITTELKN